MVINKTLATLRAEKNMSQRDLAKTLNIQPGTIGMYESGKRNPPLSRAIEIAKLFNIPVEEISFSTSNCIKDEEGN
ncbi:MAG: helix-turn-helix transcriptional regulator [Lachnospiraceae bacterium]